MCRQQELTMLSRSLWKEGRAGITEHRIRGLKGGWLAKRTEENVKGGWRDPLGGRAQPPDPASSWGVALPFRSYIILSMRLTLCQGDVRCKSVSSAEWLSMWKQGPGQGYRLRDTQATSSSALGSRRCLLEKKGGKTGVNLSVTLWSGDLCEWIVTLLPITHHWNRAGDRGEHLVFPSPFTKIYTHSFIQKVQIAFSSKIPVIKYRLWGN